MRPPFRSELLRFALAAALVLGAFYSFLLARAGWLFSLDTVSSVPKAVELTPYNAKYLARLAAWQPAQRVALLERAIQLNPFDFESLIQLGFISEFQRHDVTRGEQYYLRAADVNKMFLPKWTLTNFYFRQARPADFFRWATATLAITPYSPEPIFLQMWLMSRDAGRISRAVPDRPRVLLPYAWFLSNSRQTVPIPGVVQRLVQAVGKGDPHAWGRDDLLANIEDRLLADGDRNTALAVWNTMVSARWIDDSVPSVSRPVTNGNFERTWYQHGFDWIPRSTTGVRIDQIPAAHLVRLQFSGDEPEQCPVLEQYIPLAPGMPYDLHWELESALAEQPSGLHWTLRPAGYTAQQERVSPDLDSANRQSWQFQTPPGMTLGLLTLEYMRPVGHVRARGTVLLKSVVSVER